MKAIITKKTKKKNDVSIALTNLIFLLSTSNAKLHLTTVGVIIIHGLSDLSNTQQVPIHMLFISW